MITKTIPVIRLATGLLVLLLSGCGAESYPPVEILDATMFTYEIAADKETRFTRTNVVPLKQGQGYGWMIVLRTNRAKVSYVEQLTLSGPTRFGIGDKFKYDLSADKRTVTIYREKEGNTGLIQSGWTISEDDPPGKATLKIVIEGKVEQKFEFEIKR